MSALRVVFMGTPDFAVPSLQALLDAGHDVKAVFTQPDRPRGRGHKMSFSPVKRAAEAADVPVYQPRTLRDEQTMKALRGLSPDVIVVVAYGQLLPKSVLDLPRLGCVNVHASLLPRHRGAAPIQAALAAGDRVTGITTMFMDEGLDTGDMIFRHEIPIGPQDDAGTMHDRLAAAGADVLVETLAALAAGTAPRTPQNDTEATYAARLTREDAKIDWTATAATVSNHVRAFAPRPGAYTVHRERTIKILGARPWDADVMAGVDTSRRDGWSAALPGAVVAVEQAGFVVQTGDGALLVTKVQPAGRGPMSGRDYSNGFRLEVGETLGSGADASYV